MKQNRKYFFMRLLCGLANWAVLLNNSRKAFLSSFEFGSGDLQEHLGRGRACEGLKVWINKLVLHHSHAAVATNPTDLSQQGSCSRAAAPALWEESAEVVCTSGLKASRPCPTRRGPCSRPWTCWKDDILGTLGNENFGKKVSYGWYNFKAL